MQKGYSNMNNASMSYVKNKLNNRKAKKRFGQNFLIDANIAKKISLLQNLPTRHTTFIRVANLQSAL